MAAYRFTGFYRPAGMAYLRQDDDQVRYLDSHCNVVGYDLDLERDHVLVFRVKFPDDGHELWALPEEIDFRTDKLDAPDAKEVV